MDITAEERLEEKLLIMVYSKEVFEGNLIRQDRPRCCGEDINLFETKVSFKDIELGGKGYTLLEPICPVCGRRIEAAYHLIH
jgi:hypothetical protein